MKKFYKMNLVLASAGLLTAGVAGSALAFHSGGVAECGGCHSMHSPNMASGFLLKGSDQSSTCLACHESPGDTAPRSYHISTADTDMGPGIAPIQRSPGGDFGWLKKDYAWTFSYGAPGSEDGDRHGHNIVAADQGYVADATNTIAPGGTFPASSLQCNSCHDPHGKYRRMSDGTVATTGAPIIGSGSYDTSKVPGLGEAVGVYRLLAGSGYASTASLGVTYTGVPAAVAPATYNRSEAVTQTRVAYGVQTTGGNNQWGQWCGTCHGDMHSSGAYVHPVDQPLGATIAALYNAYVASGDMTGIATTAYLSLAPFAQAAGDFTSLATNAKNDDTVLAGPGTGDEVMCLSCHRAHASGFNSMLRWNNESDFIVYDSHYPDAGTPAEVNYARGRTSAELEDAYYDRPATEFATYQRGLCNKCHAKD
ncbi:MAG: cytochrome C [Thermodesulfobacteriota bacterium]